MGVLGLFKSLCKRFPTIRRQFSDLSCPKTDCFYIDTNCLIYTAVSNSRYDSDDPYTNVINETLRYVDFLVSIVQPGKLLYFAFDGPAPLAKVHQQRKRRYLAEKANAHSFDGLQISVGTEFMDILDERFRDFIEIRRSESSIWRKPDIIYSSHRVPGEGEHKIVEFLRGKPKTNLVHMIFSPDADVMFLASSISKDTIYILRTIDSSFYDKYDSPQDTSPDSFFVIHVPILMELLSITFYEKIIDDMSIVSREFCLICFLLGNDFIPVFSEVNFKKITLDDIIDSYVKNVSSKGEYLVNDDLSLNLLNIMHFFESITDNNHYEFKTTKSARDYFKKKVKYVKVSDEKKIVFNAISSYSFVIDYYFKGCPSWSWYYEYSYSPPLKLIVEHILDYEVTPYDISTPSLPFEQLMFIFPPAAAKYLPEPLAELMEGELKHFYPREFEIDSSFGEFSAIPLLPELDFQLIRQKVREREHLLSESERLRNTFHRIVLFSETGITEISHEDYYLEISSVPLILNSRIKDNRRHIICTNRTDVLKCFGQNGKFTTIVLSIDLSKYEIRPYISPEDCKNIVNKYVQYDFPINAIGRVKEVHSDDRTFEYVKKHYYSTYGIHITSKYVLSVEKLTYCNMHKTFLDVCDVIKVPFELCQPLEPSIIPRIINPLKQLRVGQMALVTGGRNQSKIVQVIGISGQTARVRVLRYSQIKFKDITLEEYYPLESVRNYERFNSFLMSIFRLYSLNKHAAKGKCKTVGFPHVMWESGEILCSRYILEKVKKFISICSDIRKPNYQNVSTNPQVIEFVRGLQLTPVRADFVYLPYNAYSQLENDLPEYSPKYSDTNQVLDVPVSSLVFEGCQIINRCEYNLLDRVVRLSDMIQGTVVGYIPSTMILYVLLDREDPLGITLNKVFIEPRCVVGYYYDFYKVTA